ncbi:POP1-domain-containing protein [Punctularia strigosozonata HHB-11173 SS5]|uniref:POP1-domain-containing protein n=1 Tax=Punctularia strigosozonata (strain HHB-11173) TaxID=741275 RepID=UPI00044180C1|nr:POP1-domain-containing protein [Punctularia strigosozonata HHB-11173 SS5]EIN12776.1 POP1-domain-containing protein [Punctularia strigosozonata HHB-11173 SS5]
MQGLPATIDVERFAEARAFEIRAMEDAMQSARGASTYRAWQELPRHLRRRAASHDVRRVPARLREKARSEVRRLFMDPVQKKKANRALPKRGKANRISRTEQLLKRQRDKTWLETHIWHAKRMHMENMWGYRLAVTPTEKSYRPSHRASVHGSILHDASYYSLIEMKGHHDMVALLLEKCCDFQGPSPGAIRFTSGTKVMETHLYHYGRYPLGLIAPATIIWRPNTADAGPSHQTHEKKAGSRGKAKRKGKDVEIFAPNYEPHRERTVWIRCHPAAFEDVFRALQTSASFALETVKGATDEQGEPKKYEVEILDLRDGVNVFEIMGPKASQVLHGALTPCQTQQRPEFKKFWSSLANLQSAGSVPRGMVIGCTVEDPRLDFPPKNTKIASHGNGNPSLTAVAMTPSTTLAQSDIWLSDTRKSLSQPKFKKKDIDKRKSENLVPGSALHPTPDDNRVPILLIQRSVENASHGLEGSSSAPSSSAVHGWSLIVPAGWGMPFLSSLVYTGTRVGGQRERAVQAFEAGMAYYPRDYPPTIAYNEDAAKHEKAERDRWERTPPAKRVNYERLGTRSPWTADWEVVLGLTPPPQSREREQGFLSTQRSLRDDDGEDDEQDGDEEGDEEEAGRGKSDEGDISAEEAMDVADANANAEVKGPDCWLLRGVTTEEIVRKLGKTIDQASALLAEVNQLRMKRGFGDLGSQISAQDLLRSALVGVKIVMTGRGAPENLALIHTICDNEARQWLTLEARRKSLSTAVHDEDEIPEEKEMGELPALQESIIGYVTAGNFSLSRGKGHAVGCVALTRLLKLYEQAKRLKTAHLLVKIRDRNSVTCRGAHIELLEHNGRTSS